MFAGAGRIVPFLAASVALHAVVLVTAHPERLSIAPALAGNARSVSVRLIAMGEQVPKDVEQKAEQPATERRTTKPESRIETERKKARAETTQSLKQPARPRTHVETVATTTEETTTEPATESRHKQAPAPVRATGSDSEIETESASESGRGPESKREPQPESPRTLARTDAEDTPKARDASGGAAQASAHARRARSEVATRLARYFHYPRLARRQGWEGRVVLAFRIAPDGRVLDIRVAQSSGRAILDQAAVRALKQVKRIPALARSNPHESLALEIPIVYRLRTARGYSGPGYA